MPAPRAKAGLATKRSPQERPAATTELPLFVRGLPSDREDDRLPQVEDEPQAPMPVRKPVPVEASAPAAASAVPAPAPTLSRPVPARSLGPMDRDLLDGLERIERRERTLAARESKPDELVASASARLLSAVIDGGFLAGVALVVVWTVLRWCGLPAAGASILPIAPMAAFLVFVGAGYLLMFTAAGGQTIGKMLAGVRVVDDSGDAPRPPTGRQAAWRACLTVPSVLLFGLGFVPALVGEHRAVHDRLSHTRVVRA
jgi:uncharacterized RDD family membrane protein YckC